MPEAGDAVGNDGTEESSTLIESLRVPEPERDAWRALELLIFDAARAVVLSEKYPCPVGEWTSTSAHDLAQEFWSTGRADKVVLRARNDRHLRNLVRVEVRNIVIAGLRKAGRSALRDRLTDVLSQGEFVHEADGWRLTSHDPGVMYQAGLESLIAAAFDVPVDRLRVKEKSLRESSFASRAQIAEMLTAVLTCAGAGMTLAAIEAVAQRWLTMTPPTSEVAVEARDKDPGAEGPAPSGRHKVRHPSRVASSDEPAAVGPTVESDVDRIWDRLSVDERTILLYMDPDDTVRETATAVGFGRDKVSRVINTAKDVLRQELSPLAYDERVAVLRRLCERQLAAVHHRTEPDEGALKGAETHDHAPQ